MYTPLLDAIRRNRGRLDELELCILWMGDEQQASEDDLETAERAAEKLAALRRVAEAAREFLDDETFLRPYTTTQEDALKSAFAEYDKCRAA